MTIPRFSIGEFEQIRVKKLNALDGRVAVLEAGGGGGGGAVTSFNTRIGAITLASADVTGALGFTPATSSHSHAWGTLTGTLSAQGDLQTALGDRLVVSRLHALHLDSLSGKYNFLEVGGAGGGIVSMGADDTGTGWPYFSFAEDTGAEWALFGTLTANGRVAITGSKAWEFTSNPYVGTNAIYHAGNLVAFVTKTAGYTETVTSGELLIKADLAAGFTIVLPTAVGNRAKIHIKKMQAAGSIIVDGAGAETIDGGLTATLTIQYETISLVSDNANWNIV